MDKLSKISEFLSFKPTNKSPQRVLDIAQTFCKRDKITDIEAITKYEKYMKWWQSKYRDRDIQYIPKEEKPVDFEFFCQTKMYFAKCEIGKTLMDEYIFGNIDVNVLEKRVIQLEKRYNL